MSTKSRIIGSFPFREGYSDLYGNVIYGNRIDEVTAERYVDWLEEIQSLSTPPPHNAFTQCAASKVRCTTGVHPLPTSDRSYRFSYRYNSAKSRFEVTSVEETSSGFLYAACAPSRRVRLETRSTELETIIQDMLVGLASQPVQDGKNWVQSLIELRDLPKTVRTVGDIAAFFHGNARKLSRLSKSQLASRGLTARQIERLGNWKRGPISHAVDAYLGYVFGVAPTLSDLRASFDKLKPSLAKPSVKHYARGQTVRVNRTVRPEGLPVDKVVNVYEREVEFLGSRFLDYSGGTYTISTKDDLGIAFNLRASGYSDDRSSNSWPSEARNAYEVVVHHLTAFGRVRDDVDFQGVAPVLQAANPLSTAWELIPFSFVVDWFADLGKWLKQENRLAAAKYGGFYLDPTQGIWLGDRVVTKTYRPQLELNLVMDEPEWVGTEYQYPSGYLPRFRTKFRVERGVQFVPCEETISYTRRRIADGVKFAHINTKSLGDQGFFQWTAGSALAIQNCSKLKAILGSDVGKLFRRR